MRIYTRTGDDGTTGLIGGRRVRKSDARMECCGTVDELNASLGLAAVVSPADVAEHLREAQNDLFIAGAHLALPGTDGGGELLPALDESLIARLEEQIDAAQAELPPLKEFILPGGSEAAARIHLARTICRRAERLLVAFAAEHALPPMLGPYFNRLSDWLFVMARLANHRLGVDDVPWRKPHR